MSDLLKGLSRAKRHQVVGEAARLLALLGVSKMDAQSVAAAQEALRVSLPSRGPIEGLTRVPIGDYHLAAMLLARPNVSRPRVEELDILRAWVLVATLRFCAETGESDQHSRAAEGLRVVRRIVGKKYETDLLSDLPSFGASFESVIASLAKAQSSFRTRAPTAFEKIEMLMRLLYSARRVESPAARRGGDHHHAETYVPDLIIEQTDEVTAVFESASTDPGACAEEQAEDRSLLYYRFHDPLPADLRGKALAARQVDLFEAEERERGWTGDFAALSDQEARAVWDRALNSVHPGARVALAMMIFGRSVVELGSEPAVGESWWEAGGIGYALDVPLTTEKSFEKNRFVMIPPFELRQKFAGMSDLEAGQGRLKGFLATLDMSRPIGVSHLTRALRDGMPRADPAIVGLLTGRSVADVVQMYYTQVRARQLQEVWKTALSDRFGADLEVEITAPKGVVGTLKAPSRTLVKSYFENLISLASSPERHSNPEFNGALQRFADLANLCGAILSFLTARRPHGGAFEPFGQIVGRSRSRLLLAGKGGRLVDDGRWVPLCPTAMRVVKIWQAHCRDLASSKLWVFPQLRKALEAAADGTSAPFFSLDSVDASPSPLTAVQHWERAGLPAQRGPAKATNWARHYVRSALVERNVPAHTIDAFFGHGGSARDPLTPVGAMSLAENDALSATLEDIWQDLGVDLGKLSA
ncbi:hypothetical protein [Celeribacter sp.]|uniref:hypothetical protein n=1 Tax=Celeribacter sp. TaxID=1890673 RepID=UPI003A958C41